MTLDMASRFKNVEIAQELIRNGADYTIQNKKGKDGLYKFSAKKRKMILECIPLEIKEPGDY
jgi:ankyrin repeat protein